MSNAPAKRLSLTDIKAALAKERRPHIRQRLLAIKYVITGLTRVAAGHKLGVAEGTVRYWVTRARSAGLSALTATAHRPPIEKQIAKEIRDAITERLGDCRSDRERRKLNAISAVLEGQNETAAAEQFGLCTRTLREWLAQARKHGATVLFARSPADQWKVDATGLRTLAERESDPQVARRLLAVAYLAEGQTLRETASQLDLPASTLGRWYHRYRAGGVNALRMVRIDTRHPVLERFGPKRLAKLQDEVSTALAESPPTTTLKRLQSVQALLSGKPLSAVAKEADVSTDTCQNWLALVEREGIQAFLPSRKTSKPRITAVSADELLAASQGAPVWQRQRLLALRDIILGYSCADAARRNSAERVSVRNWVKIANCSGWRALLNYRPTDPRRMAITPAVGEKLQDAIATALNGQLTPLERIRLSNVLHLLSGEDMHSVAGRAAIAPATLKAWLVKAARGGVEALLTKKVARDPLLKADGAELRRLASQESSPRVAKALMALGHIADGRAFEDAGVAVGVAHSTVQLWLKRFLSGGYDELRRYVTRNERVLLDVRKMATSPRGEGAPYSSGVT